MREKPVSQERVHKYIRFLRNVFEASDHHNQTNILTLSEIAKECKVSSAAPKALHAMAVIAKHEGKPKKWTWIDEPPSKSLALKVLDHLLHKNKKTVHFPIPEFAGISQSLETIVDRLTQIYVQNEKVLKTSKNSVVSGEQDLFRVDDQRLYIAGQIASGVYSQIDYIDAIDQYNERNDKIITATDDLMNRLLKRSNTQPIIVKYQKNGAVAVCKVCNKPIHLDEPYVEDTANKVFYCFSHTPEEFKLK